MAKKDREFVVPFEGLKIGKHMFDFELTDAFFETVEYSLIEKGDVKVTFELEKKETMMIGNFSIEGTVTTSCDLCNDPVVVPVNGDFKLIFKFGTEPSDDETLIVVYPDEFELDLKDHLLELVTVCLPSRTIHEEGDCDEEMIDVLDQYRVNPDDDDLYDDEEEDDDDEEPVDPRWQALKNLNNKN